MCRTVLIAIPTCVAGVAFITQPSFLGFDKHATRNPWGVLFASGQVCKAYSVGTLTLVQCL